MRAMASLATMSGSRGIRRRGERDPQVLHQPHARAADRVGRRAERDAVQPPGGSAALRVALGDAVAHVVVVPAEVHYVAEDVLARAGGVEQLVAVEVLGVEHPVAAGTAGAEVAPGEDQAARSSSVREQSSSSPIGPPGTSKMGGRSPRMPMSSTSALKMPTSVRSVSSSPRPTSWRPREDGVGTVHGHGVRRERDRVLAHRTQIDHQTEAGEGGRVARRLQGPELEELVAGEVEAGGAEPGHHRAPSRSEVPPRLRPARGVVALDDAARGVGVQRRVEHRLAAAPLARPAG